MIRLFTILFFVSISYLQAQTIKGKVTDAFTNEKIIGASVKMLNSDKGTVTDAEGMFFWKEKA